MTLAARATLLLTLAAPSLLGHFLSAQQPPEPGAAPVPAPIVAAKKVFIANAPGENLPPAMGGPLRTYNQFYAAMKAWGRYDLVASPTDADVVFAISLAAPIGAVHVSNGSGDSWSEPQIRLLLIDPHTQVPLWWFQEDVEAAILAKNANKKLDEAMTRLVDRVKKLVPAPPADTTAAADAAKN